MFENILIYFLIATIPLWGYLVLLNTKINPSLCGWAIALGFIASIFFFVEASPLVLMFLYITSTFWSLKIVVANNQRKTTSNTLTFAQWCLFCYGWFGMNPNAFKTFPSAALNDFSFHIKKGISRIIFGIVLINFAKWFFTKIVQNHQFEYLEYTCYLVGLSLILHFGLLNISTGLLRSKGINVSVLFNNPLKSKTLHEFWSRRWNVAFVELTTIAVLRPIKKRFSPNFAVGASYVFSGLLHELAISLPVRSGYGKPFFYFILQAVLILFIEKHLIKPTTNATKRLLWLLACLFLPIFILFHRQFILHIVLPLAEFFSVV